MLLGRRGPAQAAFTNPELRELGELQDADVTVDPADVVLDEHSEQAIARQGELTERRNVEILTDYSQRAAGGQAQAGRAALLRLAGRDSRVDAGRRASRSCTTR